jgi:filamentous hemagglutinin
MCGTSIRFTLNDSRWPSAEGWIKKQQINNGIEIHYVYNNITKQIDDFKFIN